MPVEVEAEDVAVLNIQSEDPHVCRICHSSERQDDLIAPCLCKGIELKVHRKCLDECRSQESYPRAFSHCPICAFQYVTDLVIQTPSDVRCAQFQYRFLVARDLGAFFMMLQLILCGLAKLIHLGDPLERIPALYPKEWAEKNQNSFSIGPYYCSAILVFLALAGILGLLKRCENGNAGNAGNLDRANFDCNCNCGGEAAGLLAGVFVMISVVLVVMGFFTAVFFGGFVVQSLIQRHMHLLARRQEARRVVVRDLSDSPELLSSLASSRDV
jgi:hypothetical protein